MLMEIMDLRDGVIKITLNHRSFLIDTEKEIDRITSVYEICADGTLVVECISNGLKAIRWIDLVPYFHMLNRDDLIKSFSDVSDLVLVS